MGYDPMMEAIMEGEVPHEPNDYEIMQQQAQQIHDLEILNKKLLWQRDWAASILACKFCIGNENQPNSDDCAWMQGCDKGKADYMDAEYNKHLAEKGG